MSWRRSVGPRAVVAAVVLAAGCGAADDEPSEFRLPRPEIAVTQVKGQPGYVSGWFPSPSAGAFGELIDEVDGCKAWLLYRCEPACARGETCTAAGTCEPAEPPKDAGDLVVNGTLAGGFVVSPMDGGYFTTIGEPVFDAGAAISIWTTGGADLAAIELEVTAPDATNISLLGIEEPGWPSLTAGEFVLEWVPEDPSATVRLSLNTEVVPITQITCESPDDGSITVPAELMAEFVAEANWSAESETGSILKRLRAAVSEVEPGYEVALVAEQLEFFDARPDR